MQRLVPVLPDYEVHQGELSLVRPPTPFEPPKLRAFIDFITAACASGRATIRGEMKQLVQVLKQQWLGAPPGGFDRRSK